MIDPAVGTTRILGRVRLTDRASPRGAPGEARGFSLVLAQSLESPGIDAAEPAGAAMLGGLLNLQEQDLTGEQDRQARKRGHEMLAALACLQRSLTGAGNDKALQRLANVAARMPAATDPALAAVLAEISLRVRVELARRSFEPAT